ncbi:MAG: DNA polymerase IV [Deltaproteobacteria bacterium]|nr:DNA polymerase IV [Deltaproteobacteria bacterium]
MDGDRPVRKTIIHLDMDAFYPSVEVVDNPTLKGKPVIVGGTRGRGVVCSASYEARKFGVHSAQPMAAALRLCPQGIFLPVRMARYVEVSRKIFSVFYRFTPLVEPLSIDEAFLDVSASTRLFGTPVEIAKNIKEAVRAETGLSVSAGVAPSKFVAKIASDMEKPDGLTVIRPEGVRGFLDPLPVSRMWGVGKKTQEELRRVNIRTFADLSRTPVETLERMFGRHGLKMHQLSTGIDEREVEPEHEAKSIGHEETYLKDILELETARRELLSLAVEVARRLRREGVSGRGLTLKVKYADFALATRSTTLSGPTDDGPEIYVEACRLLGRTAVGRKPVRLLGISLSQLTPAASEGQLPLFDVRGSGRRRKELNRALDSLYKKFGRGSVRPGTLMEE